MKFVLMQVTDEAAHDFAKHWRGTNRVVGIYDIPTRLCKCEGKEVGQNANWVRDEEQKRPVCVKCGRVSKVYITGYATRVRMALGRNILKALRG